MATDYSCRFFIAKCADLKSLQKCINTNQWACKDRVTAPIQPKKVLTTAYRECSKVVIIFSVNNCHGWHGYAEMVSKPGSGSVSLETDDCKKANSTEELNKLTTGLTHAEGCKRLQDYQISQEERVECQGLNEELPFEKPEQCQFTCRPELSSLNKVKNKNQSTNSEHAQGISETEWQYFKVNWRVEFMSQFGEQCLPFQKTAEFKCTDETPLNKARNWNEIDYDTGLKVCQQIDEHYQRLVSKRLEKLRIQESRLPAPFLKQEGTSALEGFAENWSKLVKKTEAELGKVVLACPFGSQRYNLHTAFSDMDMFVVYQASTESLLTFGKQPPQTVKSTEREVLDYTIHELYRYGELLLAGDHRCVETLFLHDTSYEVVSTPIKELIAHRRLFLNSLCFDKYLRDALGNKGLMLFEKWTKSKSREQIMSERESKLAYIILRLLQNAKNIVDGDDLQVYRPDSLAERKLLISLKTPGNISNIQFALDEINRLKNYIEKNRDKVPQATEEIQIFMKEWILNIRKKNLTVS